MKGAHALSQVKRRMHSAKREGAGANCLCTVLAVCNDQCVERSGTFWNPYESTAAAMGQSPADAMAQRDATSCDAVAKRRGPRRMFANRAVARATIVGVYFDVYVCSSATRPPATVARDTSARAAAGANRCVNHNLALVIAFGFSTRTTGVYYNLYTKIWHISLCLQYFSHFGSRHAAHVSCAPQHYIKCMHTHHNFMNKNRQGPQWAGSGQ